MFRFGIASSIVVHSLATWSAFGCQWNVIAIFPIFGVVNLWHTSVSSDHNAGVLSFLWYKVIENVNLNFLFFFVFKEVYYKVRKVTAVLQVVRFFNRFSLQDGSLLQCKKSDCRPASGKAFQWILTSGWKFFTM